MSTLNLIITTAGQAALSDAGTLGPVTITKVAIGSGTWATAPTASATALKTELKQITPEGSSVPAPGIIHITASDTSLDAYNVYEIGLYTSTGILFAIAGGTSIFLSKASSSVSLIAVDLSITNLTPGTLTIGDANFQYPPATETVKGVAEIATLAECNTGTDDSRMVPAKKLASYFASNGAGIATGYALADTIKTSVTPANWQASVDGRPTYSTTWYNSVGKTFISDTFNVPLGEVWEVEYDAPLNSYTDDWCAWAWLVDGALSQISPFVGTTPMTPFNTFGESIPNTFKEKLSGGTHTIVMKLGCFGAQGQSGTDRIDIGYVTPAYRVVRKYSGSATSNQVLTGYALTAVDKYTQTIADSTNRVATYTSTWYSGANYIIATDTITVPVGQVWDVEYDYPIEMQSNDQYATAWILNGVADSNTLLQTWLSANYQNAGFIPNQYKTTLQAGTHTVVFKFCIFGGSGTDLARFQYNNKVYRKYSSASTSAGVVSKATNGYCIMPNGLIMQWGKVLNVSGYQSVNTVIFPIPFNTLINASASIGFLTNNTAIAPQDVIAQLGSVGNTTMAVCFNSPNSTSIDSGAFIYWQAIGY